MTPPEERHKDNEIHRKQNQLENCKFCGTGHPQRQHPAYGKNCRGCAKTNHFNAVCRSVEKQQQDWKLPRSGMSIHDVGQDEELWPVEQEQHDRCFDLVHIKCLNFNIKSVIFTKLELYNSQKGACITYKIDPEAVVS